MYYGIRGGDRLRVGKGAGGLRRWGETAVGH
jgi:hypothetical protein